MIPLSHFMLISAALFCIGLYAVITKRNAIQVLIGIEFMINAAVLNFVALGRLDKFAGGGQMFALFAIVLGAAGVAVALAIILNVYKHFRTINPAKIDTLKD